MKAIIAYYFLSQRYERNYALITNMKNDINHASLDAIQARYHNPSIREPSQLQSHHIDFINKSEPQYTSFSNTVHPP